MEFDRLEHAPEAKNSERLSEVILKERTRAQIGFARRRVKQKSTKSGKRALSLTWLPAARYCNRSANCASQFVTE
jgi:hypothetical protein